MAGKKYILTLVFGLTDCPADESQNEKQLRCQEIEVFQPLDVYCEADSNSDNPKCLEVNDAEKWNCQQV